MADDDNFFSRWSRRKVQKQAGEVLPEVPFAGVSGAEPNAAPKAAHPLPASTTRAAVPAEAAPAQGDNPPAAQEKAPPPTLADVAKLTKDSDFSRFVGKDVSPDVRNAAMKKLFADPHFNVMDGLDIYIDDYSIPSPMSKDFARTLASAKFMKLFDEPEKTDQTIRTDQPGQDAPTLPAESASVADPAPGTAAQQSLDAPTATLESTRSGDAEPPPSTPSPVAP